MLEFESFRRPEFQTSCREFQTSVVFGLASRWASSRTKLPDVDDCPSSVSASVYPLWFKTDMSLRCKYVVAQLWWSCKCLFHVVLWDAPCPAWWHFWVDIAEIVLELRLRNLWFLSQYCASCSPQTKTTVFPRSKLQKLETVSMLGEFADGTAFNILGIVEKWASGRGVCCSVGHFVLADILSGSSRLGRNGGVLLPSVCARLEPDEGLPGFVMVVISLWFLLRGHSSTWDSFVRRDSVFEIAPLQILEPSSLCGCCIFPIMYWLPCLKNK